MDDSTNVARPNHQFTSDDWQALDDDPQFKYLVAAKRRFIIPATVFFVLYYFSLPILVGYYPILMSRNVYGNMNLAYIFALSQFVMAWLVMLLYVRRARYYDQLESQIISKVQSKTS
ncbi:MAG: DUF485 domain-containing protein [Candidatus Eremiobacteraeota bacterium]|nr:DUF485 domain-containing protein [Candidatus Eremiobacteraeota bacterium]